MGFTGSIKDKIKKAKRINPNEEFKHNYIAYEEMTYYAKSDISLERSEEKSNQIGNIPKTLWAGFNKDSLNIASKVEESSLDRIRYTIKFPITTKSYGIKRDKNLPKPINDEITVDIDILFPEKKTNKSILLLNSFYQITDSKVLDKFLKNGYTIIIPDYNGIKDDTKTKFPVDLEYCTYNALKTNTTSLIEKDKETYKKKKKIKNPPIYYTPNDHLTKILFDIENTTFYWYTYIIRETLIFVTDNIKIVDKPIIVAFKEAGDCALQVGGLDEDKITAVGLVSYSIYPELYNIPKYRTKQKFEEIDESTLQWIEGMSGISYINRIKIPLIFADPINDPKCNPDRLIDLEKVSNSPIDIFLSNNRDDNIAYQSFEEFLLRLDSAFFGSLFPKHPISTVDERNLPRISISIKTDNIIPIDHVFISYGYFEYEHSVRVWHTLTCDKVNESEYVVYFDIPASTRNDFYYYAQVKYKNGMRSTEFPKYYEIKNRFNQKEIIDLNYPLFLCSQPEPDFKSYMFNELTNLDKKFDILTENKYGLFVEEYDDAIALTNHVKLFKPKDGPYGIICEDNSMILFIGNKCSNKDADRVMKITSYSDLKNYNLTVALILNDKHETRYECTKSVKSNGKNYTSTIYECKDFRDKNGNKLTLWETVKKVVIVTPNIAIYEITML